VTTAKKAGVMGWPVAHSKSPALHGFWLRELGIHGSFVLLPVTPEDLTYELRALPERGFAGVNLTVPHKEAALLIADTVDDTARRIGATNCIIVTPSAKLRATNTDAFGFITNLAHGALTYHASAGPAVVLGAGGAARAVCVALTDAGCPEIRVVNRSRARADGLAAALGPPLKVFDWDRRAAILSDAALLVNTTSLGMHGQPPLEIDLAALPSSAVVNDIVYVPLETQLLRQAATRGLTTVDGLGMLLYQGGAHRLDRLGKIDHGGDVASLWLAGVRRRCRGASSYRRGWPRCAACCRCLSRCHEREGRRSPCPRSGRVRQSRGPRAA
jgi:shikimate dehydrogenase